MGEGSEEQRGEDGAGRAVRFPQRVRKALRKEEGDLGDQQMEKPRGPLAIT